MTDLEFALLATVQSWGTAIRPVMAAFSAAGYGAIYLLVIAFTYWCVSRTHALRLSVLLLLSSSTNTLVKVLVQAPRPYWLRPELFAGSADAAAGMPSGHAQAATAFWGLMAFFTRRPLWWAFAILMIAGTSVSRIYFGVHFPSQIVAGVAMGLALLLAFRWLEAPVCRMYFARSIAQQRLILVVIGVGIIALACVVQAVMSARWTMPQEWLANAAAVHPATPLEPLKVSTVVRDVSLLLGLLLGAGALKDSPVRYAGWRKALLRFLPGYALFGAIYAVSGLLARQLPVELQAIADGLRGLLCGLWISLWWPLLMRRYFKP